MKQTKERWFVLEGLHLPFNIERHINSTTTEYIDYCYTTLTSCDGSLLKLIRYEDYRGFTSYSTEKDGYHYGIRGTREKWARKFFKENADQTIQIQRRKYDYPESSVLHGQVVLIEASGDDGNVLIKLIFKSPDHAEKFSPPKYFGTEVTDFEHWTDRAIWDRHLG